MNFVFRRYVSNSPKNMMAYFGMLGDIATIGLLYTYHRVRKDQKIAAKELGADKEIADQL